VNHVLKYGCFDAVHIVFMLEIAQVILNNATEYKRPQKVMFCWGYKQFSWLKPNLANRTTTALCSEPA